MSENPFPDNMTQEDLIERVNGEITLDEAEYAARAINNYGPAMEMLRNQQRIHITFCGFCGGNPCRSDCKLAALLAGEPTDC